MRQNKLHNRPVNDILDNFHFYSLAILFMFILYGFFPALDNDFLSWDDQFYVTANPLIQNPTWPSLKVLMTKVVSLNFHPITMASLWFNAKVWGTATASPFIWTNVIIHLLNTALVYLLTYRLAHRKWIVALTSASIFALHPMHVESVVWVSERKDVLYGLFLLASLVTYDFYLEHRKIRLLALCFFLFLISCLSKAMAVSLVPCLFLIDYLRKVDFTGLKVYLEKIPFILLAILIGTIALDVQGGGNYFDMLSRSESAKAINLDLDVWDRIKNAAYANYFYLKNFLLPMGHSAYHPYSSAATASPILTFGLTGGFLSVLVWGIIKKRRDLVFSIGFYFVTLALVLQLIPVGSAIVADRYTYLPYIGLAYLLGHMLHRVAQTSGLRRQMLFMAVLFSLLTSAVRTQSDMWQDHITLFSQAKQTYPDDPFIRKTLASGLWSVGDLDKAIENITYAIDTLGLVTSPAFELLGNCYADKGHLQESIAYLNKAVDLDSMNVTARYHRSLSILELDPQLAISDLDHCESSDNTYVRSLIHAPRGRAHGLLGHYDRAIKDLTIAIQQFPHDINGYMDRAVTYEMTGKWSEALKDYQKIVDLDPDNAYAKERISILDENRL